MHTDVLLQNDGIGELFLTYRAGVLDPKWGFGSMDTKVCFQVSLGGECPPTYLAFERPLTSVDTVVHLESTLAAQDTMTDDTLVWVSHLLVNIFNQLLQL